MPVEVESIRDVGVRLIDDAKAYARAEVDVAKVTAFVYIGAGKTALIFGGAALVLVLAALPVLVAGLGMVLAIWIGVPGGLLAAAAIVILLAGLLGLLAVRAIAGIGEKLG